MLGTGIHVCLLQVIMLAHISPASALRGFWASYSAERIQGSFEKCYFRNQAEVPTTGRTKSDLQIQVINNWN